MLQLKTAVLYHLLLSLVGGLEFGKPHPYTHTLTSTLHWLFKRGSQHSLFAKLSPGEELPIKTDTIDAWSDSSVIHSHTITFLWCSFGL